MVKNVLITGASSGIGRATTELLASKGYNIFAIARNEKRLDEISGANINTLSADIATEDGRQAIKEFVGSTHLDLLINNAGLMAPSGNLSNVDLARWRYQIGVNVEAPLFLTQNLLENLSGGRVLNITIYSSFHVRPGLAAYGTSKAALNMLTEYMRHDFSKFQIAVGLVLPGIVDTAIQSQLPKDDGLMGAGGTDSTKEGKLLSPQLAAEFLAWVCLETSVEQFNSGIFDIYDKKLQASWNLNNILITRPM